MSFLSNTYPEYKILGVRVITKEDYTECFICDWRSEDDFELIVDIEIPKIFDPLEYYPDGDERGKVHLCWGCANGFDHPDEYVMTTENFTTLYSHGDCGYFLQKGFTFRRSEYLFVTVNETDSNTVTNFDAVKAKWIFDPNEPDWVKDMIGKWVLKKTTLTLADLKALVE